MPLPRCAAPPGAWVDQHLAADHIADVRGTTRERVLAFGLGSRVHRGDTIAITAGSRGIGGLVELLGGIVDAVRECGGEPFVIPAMGSHGGATPDGQTEILRILGVTEQSVGAPVRATMDTIALGPASNGAVAHLDRNAAEASGIIVLGRVKTHPESIGELASGLLKMVVVGLGKQSGAHQAHSHGLWDSVRAVPKVTMAHAKILGGVAVVESGYKRPVAIEAVAPTYEAFLDADVRLLRVAKAHLGAVPARELDVLVVDRLGKDQSGAGMDPSVIGRWRLGGGPKLPDYKRVVVLRLTDASLGNGLGIGMADFTTRRFVDAYDPAVTHVNLLTASEPGGNTIEGHVPLALESDREAIEVALFSALAKDRPRVCRIASTEELGRLWMSEALLEEARLDPKLTVIGDVAPMPFDAQGNLL